MVEKNIFVDKLFLSLNISDCSLFLSKTWNYAHVGLLPDIFIILFYKNIACSKVVYIKKILIDFHLNQLSSVICYK